MKLIAILMVILLLAGCQSSQGELPAADPTTASTAEPTQNTTEEDVVDEIEASTHYMQNVYPKQIERYYTAISQKWDELAYLDNEMSTLTARYYEGNPMDNVGFAFVDLDRDGIWELVIGATQDSLVFEIWDLKNGEPVMVAQSGSHNRYYLQYADDQWTVGYEAENGAANFAVYSLKLVSGEFQVIQGVVFDALANEENPWFQATDLDMDGSNDTPITEETAVTMMNATRSIYTTADYFPYSLYK